MLQVMYNLTMHKSHKHSVKQQKLDTNASMLF